jgi:hypothetical protein
LLSALSTDNKVLLYADDTSILVSSTNIDEIQLRSKLMLNSLSHWFTCNCLSLNVKKTKLLKFDTINRGNMPTHLKFNDELLHEESHIKFLGMKLISP